VLVGGASAAVGSSCGVSVAATFVAVDSGRGAFVEVLSVVFTTVVGCCTDSVAVGVDIASLAWAQPTAKINPRNIIT
jgi:hypothetical protein